MKGLMKNISKQFRHKETHVRCSISLEVDININSITRTSGEDKEKYQLGDFYMI